MWWSLAGCALGLFYLGVVGSPLDRIDTMLWLPTTEITVLENRDALNPYLLVNTDDGEKAAARYLGLRK